MFLGSSPGNNLNAGIQTHQADESKIGRSVSINWSQYTSLLDINGQTVENQVTFDKYFISYTIGRINLRSLLYIQKSKDHLSIKNEEIPSSQKLNNVTDYDWTVA